MKDLSSLLVLLLSLIVQVRAVEYLEALAELKSTTVWPVPGQTADSIAASFGPVKNTSNPYHWHRGFDIDGTHNEPIVASLAGTVVQVTSTTSNGLQVILEHDFGQPVTFHNHQVTKFYTMYFHLESTSVVVDDTVKAGQEIGTMGAALNGVHLHHEVLVGTRCDLQSAIRNPNLSCNTLGVDPSVNPVLIYPEEIFGDMEELTASLHQRLGLNQNGAAMVHGRPVANRFVVQAYENSTLVEDHVLDLNLRIGFNATTREALDTQDRSKPFLLPMVYETHYEACVVVPHKWVPDNATKVVVEVYNVMNVKVGTVVLCKGNGNKSCDRMY